MANFSEVNCYSVSELNQQARSCLEESFGAVWVQGEISNFVTHRSGHWYFSLKDPKSQIRCAMFAYANAGVKNSIKEGQSVKVLAKVSLYTDRGDYQLIVQSMLLTGNGALQAEFEHLKKKLQQAGLFDSARKQILSPYYDDIAVLSSASGAAIQDVLTTLKQRSIGQKITIYPCFVQGKSAAVSIQAALDRAIAMKPQVILLVRGGGSLEDLCCFNDERLARSIARSVIPIVSGVGHEIDTTLCDFVADYRAATPTAAAVSISPDPIALKAYLKQQPLRLVQYVTNYFVTSKQYLKSCCHKLQSFAIRLLQKQQDLDQHLTRLLQGVNQNFKLHQLCYEAVQKRFHPQLVPMLLYHARLDPIFFAFGKIIDRIFGGKATTAASFIPAFRASCASKHLKKGLCSCV